MCSVRVKYSAMSKIGSKSRFGIARSARKGFSRMKLNRWEKGCALVLLICATAVASQAQTFTQLTSFANTNGSGPNALIQATDGNFYGTTESSGTNNSGTVFKITPAGTLTTLYSFCPATNSSGYCPDGAAPQTGVIQGTDGNFYGTTIAGGIANVGTVFKMTPAGALTTLYNFCSKSNCTDGEGPLGLVQGTDGNFYGTTHTGGESDDTECCGTVFKLDARGTLTTLHVFCQTNCADGNDLQAGLIQGRDGNFYGTATAGGQDNVGGTVFKITPGGTFTTFYSFCSQRDSQDYCLDGNYPLAAVLQGSDGNLYGTTSRGGTNHAGTAFKISPAGILTTLYNFCSLPNGQGYCLDGNDPAAGLIQATDGNFYGTAAGGVHTRGIAYQLTPVGELTTLYSFCAQLNCTDGRALDFGLVQATDAKFYGTTLKGGTDDAGTVFSLNLGLTPVPAYSLSASQPEQTTISPGGSLQSTVTLNSVNGYAGTVTLTCSISPVATAAPTCSFGGTSPAVVTSSGGSATLIFTAVGPSAKAARAIGGFYAWLLLLPCLSFIGAGFASANSRRKTPLRFIFLGIVLTSLLLLAGCGGGGSGGGGGGTGGTPAGAYTITITGKDANGVTQTNAGPTVTLNVT